MIGLSIYVTTEKQAVLKKKSKEKDHLSEISPAVYIWRFSICNNNCKLRVHICHNCCNCKLHKNTFHHYNGCTGETYAPLNCLFLCKFFDFKPIRTNMNFAPAFAMPKSKKNGKKGGRKRGGKKGGKGDWVGGRFEEEVDGPELGAKKCFKCQNPRAEDCCERSRGKGPDEESDEEFGEVGGGGERYGWRGVNGHGVGEWEADDEQDLCGWDGDQACSEDQKWNPEWRQATEEEQLRSLTLWGVKGREVFNIGPQYVVGGAVGLEALGTSVLKSLQSLFRKGRSFMSP